jgi:phosphatidylserine/phosphatidylglycerophosphate/cardiolipin synthase-like enzyme
MQALARLRLLAAAAVVALAGCAALPGDVERRESHTLTDVRATTLGKVAAASVPGDAADRSGFRLLPDADDALEARLALIRSAERSLDVQYYLIANDGTGRQFLAALVAAASRGVRVRVLVDDLYTAREDALFTALSALPGFEVRPLQPAACAQRRLRDAGGLLVAPVRAHQPPHAQQAADRRRQLRHHRWPQRCRRVLRPRLLELHRHGPAVDGPGRRDARGALR